MIHQDEEEFLDDQISRIKDMRLNTFLILLSCVTRMVIVSFSLDPITFLIFLVISIIGIVGDVRKSKILLSIYGYISLAQAIFVYCLVIYYGMRNPQPISFYGIYSLFIVILGIGSTSSFSQRNKIRNYENLYGDISRFRNKRRYNNNENQMNHLSVNQNNINNNNIQDNSFINNNNTFIHNNNNINNNNISQIQLPSSPVPQNLIPNVYYNKIYVPNQFNSPVISQSPHFHPSQIQPIFPLNQPQEQQNTIPFNPHLYKPQQFAPQIITHQRNVPKRNVIYQI